LLFENPLAVWCVLLFPVLSLAIGAAVPHHLARACLNLLRKTDTTAGTVGALVQRVPLVGDPRLHRDQRAFGALAVHIGVDHLIRSHAQLQILQHSLQQFLVQPKLLMWKGNRFKPLGLEVQLSF
jgi:hypothetical protein